MKRVATMVLALAVAAMLLTGLAGCGETATEDKAPLHFIEFFDPECPFCNSMKPTIEKLRQEYEGRIYKFELIDVSTTEGLAQADEFGVFITPTFVLLDADGNELDRLAGAASEENMIKFIDRGIDDVSGENVGPRDDIPTTGGTEAGTE
ncbi:MAG: thioredoxin family protein [Coriobacteriia bacterium]|nr:thioredoxin family protein [Coriobacteriia bacterium]